MKKIGIIAEYNPLHNGHLYHFEEIKRLANPDLIITIISSSFTMRGDLSIYDKFTKANQVLMLGSDIVLELPFMYTLERADIFANNTVDFLNLANVDEIWIGSEELLKKTDGIVQGMSGSPIIQDGALIGAVTHVSLKDSTLGYGIYIEWMFQDMGITIVE